MQTIKKRTKKFLFYLSLIILPCIQFCVFYLYVNGNSLLLSFKKYEYVAGELVSSFVGFSNLKQVFHDLFTEPIFQYCIKNSFFFYLLSFLSGSIFSLLFSYYIYKKRFCANFYKAMLYLPVIVSSMVLCIIYRYFYELGIPAFVKSFSEKDLIGWSSDVNIEYVLLSVFIFLLSLGSNMLVYTSTMGSISTATIEAAQIDGVSVIQEFVYIIVPSIFKTVAMFLCTGILVIFTNQFMVFNFFGTKASEEFYTFGYYLYVEVQTANGDLVQYPYIAAVGLALTFIAIPVVLTLRFLLNKFGPSED